jgi:hypothetical protein
MPGILVAGTLILVATLMHIERFAMDTARGWIWVILYAGLPPGTLLMLALQRRAGRTDAPVVRPIERWAAVLLTLAAAALLIAGAALFAVPGTTSGWWLWPLTDLTARMVGAWLAAIGATLVAVRLEGDWTRVRAATVYLATAAAAHVATLARDPGAVRWDRVAAWAYLTFDAALFALALHGLRACRERPRRGQPAPTPAIRQRTRRRREI